MAKDVYRDTVDEARYAMESYQREILDWTKNVYMNGGLVVLGPDKPRNSETIIADTRLFLGRKNEGT